MSGEYGPSPEELGLDATTTSNQVTQEAPSESSADVVTPMLPEPPQPSKETPDMPPAISPSAETASPQYESKLKGMSQREIAGRSMALAKEVIGEQLQAGTLSEDAQTDASLVLSFNGGSTEQTSKVLQATEKSLSALPGDEAKDLLKRIQENQRVKDGSGKTHTREEWTSKLNGVSPEERTVLEQQATYGYDFSDEGGSNSTEAASSTDTETSESAENNLIAVTVQELEEQRAALRDKGEDTKGIDGLLNNLRIAEKADGTAGILLKLKALEAAGASYPGNADEVNARVDAAQQIIGEQLIKSGIAPEQMAELANLLQNGDIDGFIKGIGSNNIVGMDVALFGRELQEEEIIEMLNTANIPDDIKRKINLSGGAKMAGLILLLLVVAPVVIAAKAAK